MRISLLVLVALPVFAAPQKKSQKKEAEEQAARGDAWTVGGNCEEAIKAYRRALELEEKPLTKIRLAHCLAQTNQRAEAEQILAALGDDKAALLERADIAMAAKDYKTAAGLYEKLGDKGSLLEALAAGGERERALKLCAVLKKDPTADGPTRRRAEELEGQLRYGESAADMVAARQKLASGDARGAAALLEKVVLLHPDLEEA